MKRQSRAGLSLIEVLVVMWALAIALLMGTALLVTVMRADQVSAATLRGLTGRAELADQFRTDVARAAAAPDSVGELTRGPSCLILRTPDGAHVIYQWRDGQLERIVRTAGQETRRPLPVGNQDWSAEFDRTGAGVSDPGHRPLLTLRLVEAPAHGPIRRTDVSAVLGGDLR
jgi:prepilin-type N-terminal cleavage/methylation domain-containing protein